MSPKSDVLDTCVWIMKEMSAETAAMVIGRILALERECQNSFNQIAHMDRAMDTAVTQSTVIEQDRDNRRRRMDLAMMILDETNTSIDLESIAAIVWPEQSKHYVQDGVFGTWTNPAPIVGDVADQPKTFAEANLGASTEPVATDPTQVPTEVPMVELCGYKEQMGTRLWQCSRQKGHEGHHHLDDGHELGDELCGAIGPVTGKPCILKKGHVPGVGEGDYHVTQDGSGNGEAWQVPVGIVSTDDCPKQPTLKEPIPEGPCSECGAVIGYWNEPSNAHKPECSLFRGPTIARVISTDECPKQPSFTMPAGTISTSPSIAHVRLSDD